MAGRGDGVRNVPAHGRALLVSNHAGSLFPFDATMITMAIMKEHPLPRWPRFMVLDWAFVLPFLSCVHAPCGRRPGEPAQRHAAARAGRAGDGLPRGGEGDGQAVLGALPRCSASAAAGFVEIALRTGSPIVPVAVVGSEEIYPKLGESPAARARRRGAVRARSRRRSPGSAPLGLVPLPSRWRIEFCEPIDLSAHPPEAADDRRLVFDLSEQVRETIQEKLYENLVKRRSTFL